MYSSLTMYSSLIYRLHTGNIQYRPYISRYKKWIHSSHTMYSCGSLHVSLCLINGVMNTWMYSSHTMYSSGSHIDVLITHTHNETCSHVDVFITHMSRYESWIHRSIHHTRSIQHSYISRSIRPTYRYTDHMLLHQCVISAHIIHIIPSAHIITQRSHTGNIKVNRKNCPPPGGFPIYYVP